MTDVWHFNRSVFTITNVRTTNLTNFLYLDNVPAQIPLLHTVTINATLLTLCHSDMFQPSKDHLQGAQHV